MMRWVALVLVWLGGCAGTPNVSARARAPEQRSASIAEREALADERVGVRGIEGSLSSFDVKVTMQEREEAFAACHETRSRALPMVAGTVQLAVHVLADGTVARVQVRGSTLGDRSLERCLSDVVAQTVFPKPNGGAANVTWTMMLDSVRASSAPEEWSGERVGRIVDRHAAALREACALTASSHAYDVTAYVSAGGRVLSAGVATQGDVPTEALDCIADGLREWKMPKPKGRVAKVTFALRP